MAATLDRLRMKVPRRVRRRVRNVTAKLEAKITNPRLSTRVSPHEDMLNDGSLKLYFKIGASAMDQISAGLRAAGAQQPRTVLDLPSGFGRVMRHMKAAWPNAAFTAMELQHEGARFCAKEFGARPVLSKDPLWTVDAGDGYDLLWSGSLLTHVDHDDFRAILTYFRDRLRPGGVAIFTTHGELSIDVLAGEPKAVAVLGRYVGTYGVGPQAASLAASARETGFAYTYYDEATPRWGVSLSTPEWVRSCAAEVPDLEFVSHVPAGWFQHQDVWTYRRGHGE